MSAATEPQPVTGETLLDDILAVPAARQLITAAMPALIDSPLLTQLRALPLKRVLEFEAAAGRSNPADGADALLRQLATMSTTPRIRTVPRVERPASDYEGHDVALASALVELQAGASVWRSAELRISGPSHGNPFTDVELTAEFTAPDGRTLTVGGFYDGDGVYLIRLLPDSEGDWSFTTASNARSLSGLTGAISVGPRDPADHGPVRVDAQFHFAHADGTRYTPVGTTAYAWTHQPHELQEQTLATLATAVFNKVRMCVFPKSYLFNANEPPLYPFEQAADGNWDYARFNPEYFRALERRIRQLADLGVESDLILFHAYDRWGFSTMDPDSDDRYLRYVVRRLAATPSVWWSLANEYDLLWSKPPKSWERFAQVIRENDPFGHLTSIHNCFQFYDHSREWITHCSIQRIDVYRTAENTDAWRTEWGKPIVIDECGYEGDIDQGWGNLTGEELVRRAWEAAVRGGYLSHGETYLNDRDELWWSKGGALVGESPARLGFLKEVIQAAPRQLLEPLRAEWDLPWGGDGDEYLIAYFGFNRPRFRNVVAPAGRRYAVDVIDTWAMTVTRLDGEFEGVFTVDLPGRQYMALRLVAVDGGARVATAVTTREEPEL